MRIYPKLIVTILLISIFPILFITRITYYNSRQSLQNEIIAKLNSAADGEQLDLDNFFKQRVNDLFINQHRNFIREFLLIAGRFDSAQDDPVYVKARKEVDFQLDLFQATYKYACIMLLDDSGKVLYSSNRTHELLEHDKPLAVTDPLAFQKAKDGIFIADVRKTADQEYPYTLFMVGSVKDASDKIIGFIVLEIDMAKVYEFINSHTNLGKSGEVLLVKKIEDNKVLFVSSLKFDPEGILNRSVVLGALSSLPAQKAVLGESGSGISIDYRGKEVLAAWRPLNFKSWGLIMKLDLQEALLPVDKLGKILWVILLLTIISVVITSLAIAKSISDPIHKLHRGTEIIGEGNLDYKVGTNVQDEIGQLSRAFDTMTRNLKRSIVSIDELNNEIILRQRIEKNLRQLSVAVEQSPAITVITDKNGNIGYVNPKFTQVTGYGYEEVMGKNSRFLKTLDQSQEFYQKLWKTITAGKAWRGEFHNKRKDGSLYWESALISPIKDSKGNIVNFIAIKEDITELKRVLDDLRFADAEWQRTFDSISDLVFILDKNSVILKANKACFETLKYKPEEMIGRKCYEVVHYLSSPWPNCPFQQTCMDEKIHIQEVDDPRLGATLLVTTSPIFNDQGEFMGAIHTAKDITQIKKYQLDLENKNKELEKLDQLKSDFVSIVSHELRTPLSITKEGISLVLDGIVGEINPKQNKILTTSKDNIDRLARIINSLLDISRIESGRMKLENKNVDLRALINKVAASFEVIAKGKGLELKISLPPEGPLNLYVDEDKLIQVLTNLLGNSFKFTEKGSVGISLIEKEAEMEFVVSDTGTGIRREYLPKLFNKFMQFGRTAGAGEKGTGLGLSIAKGLIELHGGRIWVESEEGKGAKFIFTLPKYSLDKISEGS